MQKTPIYKKLLERYTHEEIEKEFSGKFGLTPEELNLFLTDFEKITYTKDNVAKYANVYTFFEPKNVFIYLVVNKLELLEYIYTNKNVIETVRYICEHPYNTMTTDEKLLYYSKYVEIYNLNLGRNKKITNYGIKNLTLMTELDLTCNDKITDEGIKHLTLMTKLNLTFNENITNDAIKHMTLLQNLDLTLNFKITDNGIKHMTSIQELSLCRNEKITNDGIKGITLLKKLNLCDNKKITDNCIKSMILLQELNILNSKITHDGIKNLKLIFNTNHKNIYDFY